MKLYSLRDGLTKEQSSDLDRKLDRWENDNPAGEFTRHPQMLSWAIVLMGCGALAGYEGLWNAPPALLLGWLVAALIPYIYFNNKLNEWKGRKEQYEANLIAEMLPKK